MTLDELIFEMKQQELRQVDPARVALIEEELARRRGGLRRGIAGALVRLGARLDAAESERVVVLRRQASH
jgi:hypothetical protein